MRAHASADCWKKCCPCTIALPGVKAIGALPASSQLFSSGEISVIPVSSQSGNPTGSSCAGQSTCEGANHSGHIPSTSCGECHQCSRIPLGIGGKFNFLR